MVTNPLNELIKQAEIIYGYPAVVELRNKYIPEIKAHLESLSPDDRNLRFYMAVNDSYVERYVNNQIRWDTDKCFGIFEGGKIVAFLHLAIREKVSDTAVNAELGISVNKEFRGKGFAKKLMSRVLNYCISNSIETLVMECLKENKVMQSLAKSLNMKTYTEEDSVVAKLNFEIDDWMGRRVADYNELLYRNVSIVDRAVYKSARIIKASSMIGPV